MGFARLVAASVVYPTLVAVLILTGLVAYATIFTGRTLPRTTGTPTSTSTPTASPSAELMRGHGQTSVETNGVRLNVIEAGDRASSSKKLAVLLHGFPETALLSWHEQIPVLVAEGYFVVAPDQRGYNQSAKPESVEAYYIDHLADDVKGLLDHYGCTKAVVIGHDWGAAVAWWFAQRHPEAVEKLVVMNVPHGRAFKEHLSSSLSQLMKSWYVFYFQLPYLPELAHNNYSFLQGIPAGSGIVGKTFPLDSLPRYMQAWSEPGALTGMLNWYRATLRYAKRANGVDPTIRVPTQIIWGKKDIALDSEMVEKSLAFCAPGMCKATYFDDATHWVQHDEPEKVAHLLTSFLCS